MARVDYVIDVRLNFFTKGKQTSSSTSIKNKKNKTGTKRNIDNGSSIADYTGGAKKALSMIKPFIVAGAVIAGASKTVNTANRAVGMITNNRYREQRISDMSSAMFNPIGFGKDAFQYALNRHFEVMRDNQRIDYNRELSGNTLPYMSKSGGVTI